MGEKEKRDNFTEMGKEVEVLTECLDLPNVRITIKGKVKNMHITINNFNESGEDE